MNNVASKRGEGIEPKMMETSPSQPMPELCTFRTVSIGAGLVTDASSSYFLYISCLDLSRIQNSSGKNQNCVGKYLAKITFGWSFN